MAPEASTATPSGQINCPAEVPSPTTVLMMPAVLTMRIRPWVVVAFWSE
jgi:hypothetical protein